MSLVLTTSASQKGSYLALDTCFRTFLGSTIRQFSPDDMPLPFETGKAHINVSLGYEGGVTTPEYPCSHQCDVKVV